MASQRLFLLLLSGLFLACGVEARGLGRDSANACKGFGCRLNYNDLRRTFEGNPSSTFLDEVLHSLTGQNPIKKEWTAINKLSDADTVPDGFKVKKQWMESNETGSFNSSDETSGNWSANGAQLRVIGDQNVNVTQVDNATFEMTDNRTLFVLSSMKMAFFADDNDSDIQFFIMKLNHFANESGGEYVEFANSTSFSFGGLYFPKNNKTFAQLNQTTFQATNITNQITQSQSNTTGTLSFNDEHGEFNGTKKGVSQQPSTGLLDGTENMSETAILLRKLLQLPFQSSETPTRWTTKFAGDWKKKELYKFFTNANVTVHTHPETKSSTRASGFFWEVDDPSNKEHQLVFITNILFNILRTFL